MKVFSRLLILSLLLSYGFVSVSQAQEQHQENEKKEDALSLENFKLSGYGSLNYYNYDWETSPKRRNVLDAERFVLYPGYVYNDQFRIKGEIEFEHGGTGVTKEFDRLEEFGEFETEVENGGEVNLEQLHVVYEPSDNLGFRIGKFKLPFGIVSVEDEPTDYYTTKRAPEMSSVIPANWYEIGLQIFGNIGASKRLSYALSVVNGLDATGFSSANWIKRGTQGKFETVNAENFAVALRMDYQLKEEWVVGLSGYLGNSTDNRPKPDLNADGYVSVIDGHLIIEEGPFSFRAMGLYGHLQNADKISQANKNLSNNLNVKRTPVASTAVSYYGQLAYDAGTLLKIEDQLSLFGRYSFYDSMHSVVENIISDNPRWERTTYTAGINYKPIDQIVFKTQYTHRLLGISKNNIENTFSAGVGFEF